MVSHKFRSWFCYWQWTACLNHDGYSILEVDGRTVRGYAWAYENFIGPVPTGLEIDHLCRNRACVNPAHLEAVTPLENNRRGEGAAALNSRKTQCPQGHPYDEENTYRRPGSTVRYCRACQRVRRGQRK